MGYSFDLKTPCANCPYRKTGGIRLTPSRVADLIDYAIGDPGKTFPCHKAHYADKPRNMNCAGHAIFAEKNKHRNQMLQIAQRLGLYDPSALRGHDEVFDTAEEMMETAVERRCDGVQRR